MKTQIQSKLGRQLDQARKYGGSGRNMVWKAAAKADFADLEARASRHFAVVAGKAAERAARLEANRITNAVFEAQQAKRKPQ